MGVSKVTLNGDTLMDITSDTVDATNLLTGFTAHGADGENVAGAYTPVTYDVATQTTDGLMSSTDKVKLNGIATGAEVNQNAFSNVKISSTTIAADTKTDTLTLIAGDNITLTPNTTNDSVTIAATDTTYTAASATPLMDGTGTVGTSIKYAREDHVHPSDTTKVDKVSGKGLSTNDYTTTEKNKLSGIAEGAEVNVQSDWNESSSSSDAFIKNKPTIPTIPANIVTDASYVHTDNNYTTTEKNKLAGIAAGAEVNVQSDWNVTDTSSDAFIKNKPTIPTIESQFTLLIATIDWSSTTTTVNSIPYYTATITASNLVKEYPTIYCGSSSTLPSAQEKDAFNLINYAIADLTNHTITFYAVIKPTIALTINVIG